MSESPTTAMVHPGDVESIDAIITAGYRIISGNAAEEREWTRLRSLYAPGARLIPCSREAGVRIPDGQPPIPLDVDGWIARVQDYFDKNGFFEVEIGRRTEEYDQIAHAFSSYESRHRADDTEPFMRGINSFQLFYDQRRWWILNIFWQQENLENPIPDKYLKY
jgi:hypothetical protein